MAVWQTGCLQTFFGRLLARIVDLLPVLCICLQRKASVHGQVFTPWVFTP